MPFAPGASGYVVETVLEPHRSRAETRCRCGTHLLPGTDCVSFARPPEAVRELLESLPFCSRLCARAYLLEALALLECAVAPATVRDRDEVLGALAQLYVQLTTAGS